MDHLIDKIRTLLNQITESKYIGALDVKLDNGIYILSLGLGNKDAKPISLGFQGSEEEFLKFLEKEFRKKKFQSIDRNSTTLINGDAPMYYPIIEL